MNKDQHKYFGTDGIRGKVGEWPITPKFVLKLGWAFGKVLAEEGCAKVLIGKDTRISGYMLEAALQAGLISAGINVYLLGPVPTPAVAYLTRVLDAQAGIVISASHNPYYDNGIKFFSAKGHKLSYEQESAIEIALEEKMVMADDVVLGKAFRVSDAAKRYIDFCKTTTASDIQLKGLKIVVDCANGATYHIAPTLFRELGATVIEKNVNPDGFNINVGCGSVNPETLQRQVLHEKADLGIVFDGDGDRVIMVDHEGNVLDGDNLIYIIIKHRVHLNTMQGGAVGTIMSNLGLEEALNSQGIEFVRVPVGDQHVIAELTKRKWFIGGEPSGHVVCHKDLTTGDGIITALQILSIMVSQQKSLAKLNDGFKKYPQEIINIQVEKNDDPNEIPEIQHAIEKEKKKLNGKGRIILRHSGTQPLVRVMVEGESVMQVKESVNELARVVKHLLS